MQTNDNSLMTYGEHLETFRKMLIRVFVVIIIFAVVIFLFKDTTFKLLLAPGNSDFITYKILEKLGSSMGYNMHLENFKIELINTELSNQFIVHISTSVYLALLFASPYVVIELYRYVAPALYSNERHYSLYIAIIAYFLFLLGVLMSYYVLFPFALRFLGTYQVASEVVNQINISSYISTFTTLTFLLGLVFEIPVLSLVLSWLGIIKSELMKKYRRHVVLLIFIVAAIITPPDMFTMIIVTLPMYLLYELSIIVVKYVERKIKYEKKTL